MSELSECVHVKPGWPQDSKCIVPSVKVTDAKVLMLLEIVYGKVHANTQQGVMFSPEF